MRSSRTVPEIYSLKLSFSKTFFFFFGVEQFIKAEKLIDICCSMVKRQSLISDYILKGKTLTVFSMVQHLFLRSFPLGDLTSHMPYTLLFIIAALTQTACLKHLFFFIFLTISMSLLPSKFIFLFSDTNKKRHAKSRLTLGLIFESLLYVCLLQLFSFKQMATETHCLNLI